MIVFDELDLERFAAERFRLDGSVTPGIWKAPLDLTRGDEVLTVDGWQTVTEKAWQFYEGADLTLKILGRDKLRLELPVLKLISDEGFLVYTRVLERNPRRVASLEDVSLTFYAPLEELGVGYRVKAPDGRWVALSGVDLARDRKGEIRLKRARLLADGDARLERGFRPETVELSDGTVAVEAQSVLTRSMLSRIERGELNYGH